MTEVHNGRKYGAIFLNVPARQSRGYFDYLYANLSNHKIVFVDALFGGLDVAARLQWDSINEKNYLISELERIIRDNTPDEAVLATIAPLIADDRKKVRENSYHSHLPAE